MSDEPKRHNTMPMSIEELESLRKDSRPAPATMQKIREARMLPPPPEPVTVVPCPECTLCPCCNGERAVTPERASTWKRRKSGEFKAP